MDWNTGASHTSNFQTNDFHGWASDLSHQVTATYNFSQANSSTPYSGNEQTIKMHSNTNNKIVSQLLLQHTGQSQNYQPVFQNASVSATDFRMPQHLVDRGPVLSTSLPTMTIQTQGGIVQNPWPNSNIRVFPSAAVPGTAVNSMQNTSQALYMSPVIYSNCPQKNSNSIKTSVYPQASSYSKRKLAPKAIYNLNGPSTSQACAKVPLNPTSSHHLNSQQNVPWCITPSGQNNQNQINGQSSAALAKLQQYSSGHVFSTPYTAASRNYGDATQVVPAVANIKPPPPYPAQPVQTSSGRLAQPVSNASNENVQNYQSLRLDQNSAEQSMQNHQIPQSEQSARETNEASSTADQSSNESELIPVESICKNMQISAPQTTKLLEVEENLPSSSENLSSIPKARLVMDIQNLPDFEKVLHKFKDIEVKHKLYISVMNTKTSGVTDNKNPNVSLPSPINTTQNQTSLLPHDAKQVFKSPSHDAVLNQPLPLASRGSSQSHKVPLPIAKEHLYPILRDLLVGTVDEDLLNAYAEKVDKNRSGNAAVQENGSFCSLLVPGGDQCETNVKSNEETFRESQKISAVPTQEPLAGTNNSLSFQQQPRTAKTQLANLSTVPGRHLFHHFKINKAKLLARLSSSVQNAAASNRSSLSLIKTAVKECNEKFQSLAMCPELLQQSQNTGLQTSEQNVTTKSSGSVPDASSLALPVAKAAGTTPEAGTAQKPSMTENACAMEGPCSLEELEASLALWLKNFPSTMESTVNLSSERDGEKTQQTLENLPNALSQSNRTTVETNNVASSLENPLDAVSSSSLKGSELQVAIVAPLMQSKESPTMEVHKKNPSILYEMDPITEEGNLYRLQELISAVPATNRQRSSMDTCSVSDSLMQQKAAESTDKNGLMKAETNTANDCYFVKLKKVKSEVCSEDEISCLNPGSQVCATSHESDPNLLKPGETAEVECNDTMLQISSVCTLVQGDAFYNSQIANIFNTSPLTCDMKNDVSAEQQSTYEQQSTLLKGASETQVMALKKDTSLPSQGGPSKTITEKLSKDSPCLEMTQKSEVNERNYAKNNLHETTATSGEKPEPKLSYDNPYNKPLTSDDQELFGNADLFSTAVKDSLCTIQEENVQGDVLTEENHAQYSTSSESPVTWVNIQLTELLKEFPNGINDWVLQQETEMKNAIRLTERKDKERTQSCGQNPGPSDAVGQIKITILNSSQGKEYFPEHVPEQNSKHEILTCSEGKDRLSSDSVSQIETQQLKRMDNTTVVKTENETHCCMQGFMASRYAVKPCSCKVTKDLLSQSKNKLEDKPKGGENYKTDYRQSSSLETSIFHPVDSASSGDQSNKIFKNVETDIKVKESTLSPALEKLDPHKPSLEKLDPHKRTNEQEREVLPLSVGFQTLKEETVEIKINDQKNIRKNLCSDQAFPHLSAENFKKAVMQPLSKKVSYKEKRDKAVSISKKDRLHHYSMGKKHNQKYEKYKIKQDTSETHIIKGPDRLSKCLKRQMAMERKHEELGIQDNSTVMNPPKLGNSGLVSNGYKNSSLHSDEPSTKQKCEKSSINLAKNNETKSLEPREPDKSENAQPNKEIFKKMNLDKFVCTKEREKAWKYKRLLLNNRKIPKILKHRAHSSIHKINSFSKEAVLDAPNRDERTDRYLSEKATSFSKKIKKLTLQREQKKTYLNRVLFTQTAQESICLQKLEPSPSKSVWRMKSSKNTERSKTSSSSSLQPKREKPQMLEFKMCPDILFRTSASEEQVADSKKLPEKDKTPITAVKSKREDWLNYSPAKRRKTAESETQDNGCIPLDTALKLLDEAHSRTVKDSKTTFQTYRKIHLEKRSQSLDSNPIT